MEGLILDTPKSGVITMKQAFAIPLPEETKTYIPVSNEDLWKLMQQKAFQRGLQLGTPQMGIDHNGQRLFGSVEIVNMDHLDNEVRLMLGFRNSYNKSMSVGICFGSKVFVCSNMCFTGYTSEGEEAVGQVHHRHSTNVWDGLPERLDAAFDKFDVFKSYQDSFYNRLKEHDLSDAEAHNLIIQSVRSEAITARDCMVIADEWAFQANGPQNEVEEENWHPEFAPRNAWSLFNAYTEKAKKHQIKNPLEANLRSIRMNNFFKQQFMS
jgi:hypothetical protein